MPKRTSILAKLQTDRQGTPEPEAAPTSAPAPRAAKPANQPGIVKSTIYVPDAVHERLREIAFTERCKLQDLFMEGLDKVIESRGHPERARPKKAEER